MRGVAVNLPIFGPADERTVWQEYYRRRELAPHSPKPYGKVDGTWWIPACNWQPLTEAELLDAYSAARLFLDQQGYYYTPGASNRPPTREELTRAGERAARQSRQRRQREADGRRGPKQAVLI